MSDLKKQHERAVGDALVEWLNSSTGTDYAFARAGEAPDLVFSSSKGELGIEVTTAYYDGAHAKSMWDLARGIADMTEWSGKDFDEGLASEVVRLVDEKCTGQYGANCLLLIDVQAPLTTADELQAELVGRPFPDLSRFAAVYIAGRFPQTLEDEGGYSVIPLKPLPGLRSHGGATGRTTGR